MKIRSYIICATPRSGSTMLCDLLKDTGKAGVPESYYRRESIPYLAERFGLDPDKFADAVAFERAYLDAVMTAGTSATGTFGLRLMAENAPELFARLEDLYPDHADDAARMAAAFHAPVFVHLSRADKIRQAISMLKAHQTGLWHRAADGSERERIGLPGAAAYDADRIAEHLEYLKNGDQWWMQWFERHGIVPVRLTYETLIAAPQANLARILEALGLPPVIAAAIVPRTSRLADAESAEWTARFRAEKGLPPA